MIQKSPKNAEKKPVNGGVGTQKKADAFKSVTMGIEGWCSFGAKRTKSAGIPISPHPLKRSHRSETCNGRALAAGKRFCFAVSVLRPA